MKEKLINNLGLKLRAVGIALIIWLTVVNISNPEVTRTKTVPLNIVNAQILTNAGKTYEVQNGDTVTISYQVRTRDAYRITAENFRASVDLKDLYAVTGSVPVTVEVTGNRELISGTPAARPGVVRVLTEDIQNKSFALTTHPVGKAASGYEVGSMILTPDNVMVSGPVSEVGRISSVGVKVNVDGVSEDMSGTTGVTYYDANGNEIFLNDAKVFSDPQEIVYFVDMLQGKSLPLKFTVAGEAAEGFRFTGTECSVKSVAVVGERGVLDTLSELVIPDSVLNVEGAREDQNIQVDLNRFLPAGISVSGNANVTVTLKVEALNTRVFQLSAGSGIDLRGEQSGYLYKLNPEILSVELSALPETFTGITPADLKAVLDVSDMEAGVYEGELKVTAPTGTTVASVTPFTVVVSNESIGPGAAISPEAGNETGMTGEGRVSPVTEGHTEGSTEIGAENSEENNTSDRTDTGTENGVGNNQTGAAETGALPGESSAVSEEHLHR